MKKTLPYILLVLVLLLGMSSWDEREDKKQVGKICIAAMSWADGATAAQTENITINGKCTQVEVDVAENTTNNITFTVAVTTSDSGTLFSKASIADNGSTILRAYSMGATDSDFEAFLMAEEVTVTVTPSGDPGNTGATVNVGFYVE